MVGSGGINPTVRHAYYSIRGSVVAFVCAYRISGLNHLDVDAMTFAVERITETCGRYVAGTFPYEAEVDVGVVAPEGFDFGDMRYSSGLGFCAHARDSNQQCC